MNVLVTGATSPLGGHLVAALLATPAIDHVVAVGREVGAIGLPVDHPRLSYERVDLCRPRSVHDLVYGIARDRGVDVVFHDPVETAAAESTRLLLHACKDHATIRRLVLRSSTEVYDHRRPEPTLVDEDARLDPRGGDRVEADLAACTRVGAGPLSIAVLRFADILAPRVGDQLWDYLGSRVCLRPLGFDPMLCVLSLPDAVAAAAASLDTDARGAFDIVGFDVLPLSRLIAKWGRHDVPVPGTLLGPLYRLRRLALGTTFRYELNVGGFHLGTVPSGLRARQELGYRPRHPIAWPTPG